MEDLLEASVEAGVTDDPEAELSLVGDMTVMRRLGYSWGQDRQLEVD